MTKKKQLEKGEENIKENLKIKALLFQLVQKLTSKSTNQKQFTLKMKQQILQLSLLRKN